MMWPSLAFEHPGRQATDQPQRCVVVQGHGAFDVVPAVQRFRQRAPDGSAGVVDQDVDAAEFGLYRRDEFVDRVEVGQVAGVGAGLGTGGAAGLGDACDDGVEQVFTACDQHHRGAAAGELLRGGLADARGGAGQQDALALQVDDLAVDAVLQQRREDGRAHARQHDLIGQPAQRVPASHGKRV